MANKNMPLIRTYARSVKMKRRTIEEVPEKYRADVEEVLKTPEFTTEWYFQEMKTK